MCSIVIILVFSELSLQTNNYIRFSTTHFSAIARNELVPFILSTALLSAIGYLPGQQIVDCTAVAK